MTPRIVILESIHADGVESMRAYAEVDVHLGLSRAELLDTIPGFDAAVIKSVTSVDTDLLRVAQRLRCIGRAGVGTDNIDLRAVEAQRIALITTPDQNTVAVAEFTVGLVVVLARNVVDAAAAVRRGDFRRQLFEGREIAEMTVGIVGLGRAGMAVAKRLQSFGCKLLGHDPAPRDAAAFERMGGRILASLNDVFKQADLITLHVPLTEGTRALVSRPLLVTAKPGLLLINTCRGAVVDDAAMLEALNDGRVARLAVDVLYPEPPFDKTSGTSYAHPLLGHPRVLVTPHIGASTAEGQRRIALELADRMRPILASADVRLRAR